jgi:hypothetical protein
MVQKNRSSLVLVALGLLLASCATGGGIASGQKFGVQIGMPLDDASAILRQRGLQQQIPGPNTYNGGTMCGMRLLGKGEELRDFWSEHSTYVICLFGVSGRVVAITWEVNSPL